MILNSAQRSLLILALLVSTPLAAQDRLRDSLSTSEQTTRDGRASQGRVDRLSDTTRELLEKYRAELWKGQQLQLYIRQLGSTITEQEKRKEELAGQLRTIEQTREALVPLLLRMVDALESFVALDLPFQLRERAERIERLRKLMSDPELTVSEQYRRVLEAFSVEAGYGRSLEAYRAPLESGREARLVDYLRIGRTALYYISLDGSEAALWNKARKRWDALPPQNLFALKQGVRIAREQAAPELLALPVTEVEQ